MSKSRPSDGRREIVIAEGALRVPDLKLLSLFDTSGDTPEEQRERTSRLVRHMDEIVELLDRVVVGGVSDIPLDDLPTIMEQIFNRLGGAPRQKN